jgi:PAS domain S-box-containing protein
LPVSTITFSLSPRLRSDGLPTLAAAFLALCLAAVCALTAVSLLAGTLSRARWQEFAGIVLVAAVAQLFGVRNDRNQTFNTGVAFLMVGVVVLPPALLFPLILAQHLPEWVKARYPWYIQTFNIVNATLAALAASVTISAASGDAAHASPRYAAAAVAGCVVFVGCNHLLLAWMLRFARGLQVRESGLLGPHSLLVELVLVGLAPPLVALWSLSPAFVVLAAAPLVFAHRSFVVTSLRADRERAEALAGAERRYRMLVEQLPVATYILAPDSEVDYISPQIETILGFTPAEADANDEFWNERLHPEDRERIPALWREARSGNGHFRAEYRMLARDGGVVWVRDEAVVAHDEQSEPLYVQGYLADITEAKETEQAIVRLSHQNELLLGSAGEGIIGLDLDGRVTFANPAALRLTGYDADDLLGRDLHAAVHHTRADGSACAASDCRLTAVLRDGESRHLESELHWRKDGTSYPADCTTTPIREHGQPVGAVVVLRDTSERAQLEEQLRQSQKLEAVGQLAGGIAHDFNNLMTVIAGHSELALTRPHADDDGPLLEHVREISQAAQRASALTQQLLAFSRRQVLQPRLLDLNEVVAGARPLLARLIGEDLQLDVRQAPQLGSVRADRIQLEQVLMNLAVNARDAMPGGGSITLETGNVELSAADLQGHAHAHPGQFVMLAVTDSGCGIPAEIRERVFEPFFTTKEQGQGTGLGLATVYGIVAQSGGLVTVDSTVGTGTRFTLYLPRQAGEATPEQALTAAPTPTSSATSSATILIVEDEQLVRELTREMLELRGHHVLAAENGQQALELVRTTNEQIDILLTDVIMPGISGPQLAEQILDTHPHIEVIYTSGYSYDEVSRRGEIDEHLRFLPKPFTLNELSTAIAQAETSAATTPKQTLTAAPTPTSSTTTPEQTLTAAPTPTSSTTTPKQALTAAPTPTSSATSSSTILIVEDEQLVRELTREMLELRGHHVLAAENGQQALELAHTTNEQIDILLTDVSMPGIPGPQLAEQILDTHPHINVIYTSGYSYDEVSRRGETDQHLRFLPKPFTLNELSTAIAQAATSAA